MLVVSLLLWLHEARASLAKPGCQETCGNVTVPYPYGIGIGCYMHKSFEVSCNKSSPDVAHLWFVNHNKFPILEISMDSVRVTGNSRFNCNNSGNISTHVVQLDLHFSYSHKKNVYIAAGCNISAHFLSIGYGQFKEVGCVSNCITATATRSFTCNGSNGCCQSNIPIETSLFQAVILNHASEAPCNNVLVAEKEYVIVPNLYNLEDEYTYRFPVILNWVISLTSCHKARLRGDDVCGQNSRCVDSTHSLGHNCRCMKGYSGNPYLPTGCQGNFHLTKIPYIQLFIMQE